MKTYKIRNKADGSILKVTEDQLAEFGLEIPKAAKGGMIKRADGSYSRRGLWDNIRAKAAANKRAGKKGKNPTPKMLEQERKIKAAEKAYGGYMQMGGGLTDWMMGYGGMYDMDDYTPIDMMASGGCMECGGKMQEGGEKLLRNILDFSSNFKNTSTPYQLGNKSFDARFAYNRLFGPKGNFNLGFTGGLNKTWNSDDNQSSIMKTQQPAQNTPLNYNLGLNAAYNRGNTSFTGGLNYDNQSGLGANVSMKTRFDEGGNLSKAEQMEMMRPSLMGNPPSPFKFNNKKIETIPSDMDYNPNMRMNPTPLMDPYNSLQFPANQMLSYASRLPKPSYYSPAGDPNSSDVYFSSPASASDNLPFSNAVSAPDELPFSSAQSPDDKYYSTSSQMAAPSLVANSNYYNPGGDPSEEYPYYAPAQTRSGSSGPDNIYAPSDLVGKAKRMNKFQRRKFFREANEPQEQVAATPQVVSNQGTKAASQANNRSPRGFNFFNPFNMNYQGYNPLSMILPSLSGIDFGNPYINRAFSRQNYNPYMFYQDGGTKMPQWLAEARFEAAGKSDKLADYGYDQNGNLDEAGDGKWIQKATASIKKRGTEGVCTGSKFGGPSCPPGSKRYNLAKTFRKMAKSRKEYGGYAEGGVYEMDDKTIKKLQEAGYGLKIV